MMDVVKNILVSAVHAPSGDNAQPWRFVVKGNVISLWNIPGADATPYNFRERGSYIGHGAVIENIVLIAPMFGYESSVSLFPDPNKPDHIADVTLVQSQSREEPLVRLIRERATNRRMYDAQPLQPEQRNQIVESSKSFSGCEFRMLEDRGRIQSLAKTISLNERLILENREIHDRLFATIRWSAEEERQAQSGLFIRTLELPALKAVMMKWMRKWNIVIWLNRLINISGLISKDSAKLYTSASAFGLITIFSDSPSDFVLAGRCLQRIWLTVTSLGLSMQPVAALLYLAQRVRAGEANMLSMRQQQDVMLADEEIRKTFGIQEGVLAMLFRIGRAGVPSAHSLKRPPQIIFEDG